MGTSGANTPVGGRSGSATPRVEWEGFDFNTANSSVAQLRFAEGDVGTSKVSFMFGLVKGGSERSSDKGIEAVEGDKMLLEYAEERYIWARPSRFEVRGIGIFQGPPCCLAQKRVLVSRMGPKIPYRRRHWSLASLRWVPAILLEIRTRRWHLLGIEVSFAVSVTGRDLFVPVVANRDW
jgi:hypothetical protein